jgi:hypothetical protein
MSRLLKRQAKSTFKHQILLTLLCQHIIVSMSINSTPNNLKDTNCKKGHVAQWPPIPYLPVTSILKTSTSTESLKVKLNTAGNLICMEVIKDRDNKKYMKHLMTIQRLQGTKGVDEKLLLTMRELVDKNKILKALSKLRTRETCEAKELCLLEIYKAVTSH